VSTENYLNQSNENFGARPRKFSFWNLHSYLYIRRPAWLWANEDDPLYDVVGQHEEIFQTGRISWGYIVQANTQLWERGSGDLPADIVYFESASGSGEAGYLEELAADILALKEDSPANTDLAELSGHLNDDANRARGLRIPSSLSRVRRVLLSTTLVHRKHLPAGFLCSALLPIVVSESEPANVLPLPEKYWPEKFRNWWLKGEVDESGSLAASWYQRLTGGVLTLILGLIFGWVGGQATVAVATGDQALSLAMIGFIGGPFLAAIWLLNLSYRIFTGRGRRSDGGLVGPWTLMLFSFAILALGAYVLSFVGQDLGMKATLGAALIAVLGIKGILMAINRLRS